MAKGGKKQKGEVAAENATELPDNLDEMEEAAKALQARQRGNAVRKQQKFELIQLIVKADTSGIEVAKLEAMPVKELKQIAKNLGVSNAKLKKAKQNAEDMTPDEAATQIQSAFRRKAAQRRAKLKKKMKKKQTARRAAIQEEAETSALNDVSKFFEPGKGAYVRSGPDRPCTDAFCCLIFATYWFGMCFLIWFAVEYGEIDRLVRPRDMNGNSCGMLNGPDESINLQGYPQLYLPNPADETQQICVDGCPGSPPGTCKGALYEDGSVVSLIPGTGKADDIPDTGTAIKYHEEAVWGPRLGATSGGIPSQLKNWNRMHTAATAFGTQEEPVDLQVPWLTSETECVVMGDCNEVSGVNVGMHMQSTSCTRSGRCYNETRFREDGTFQKILTAAQSDTWKSSEKIACEGTTGSLTGNRFELFEWKAYDWEYEESQSDSLFICMPKEGCPVDKFPGCESDDYPPTSFIDANTNGLISQEGPCWLPVLPSEEYLFRCVPTLLLETASSTAAASTGGSGSVDGQVSVQYMKDLKDYWRVIPFGGIVAIVAAFIWIIFLGKFAYYIIVGTCILSPIVSLAVSGVCFFKLGALPTRSCAATSPTAAVAVLQACLEADLSHSPEVIDYTGYAEENCLGAVEDNGCTYTAGLFIEIPPEVQAAMDEANTTKQYTEIIAWSTLVGAFVLAVIFVIFWDRVMISIGVIEEASDAFMDIPFAIFLPLLVLLASLPVSVFCCFACFLLLSLRRVAEDGTVLLCLRDDDMTIPLTDLEDPNNTDCIFPTVLQGMIFAQIFGWLWTVQWFLSTQYTTIAGAVSKWYFTPEDPKTNSKRISAVLLSHSGIRTVRHHSGTMAFGSFIIAVVICVKFALVYAINQVQAQSPDNKVIKVFGNVLKVCVSCVERFVRFVGHLAYIETAIYGNNFCHSLFKAVQALARNAVRFSFVALFSKLVLTLGKLIVVAASLGLANLLMDSFKSPSDDEDYCAAIGSAGATPGKDCNVDGRCAWSAATETCLTDEDYCAAIGSSAGATPGKDCNVDERCAWSAATETCGTGGNDLPNQSTPVFPMVLVFFFSGTISLNIMGVYETAIDTIMVSFLEDERENDGNGEVTFAAGPLKEFMKSTKSIADATQKYAEDIKNAKTDKIRANSEVTKKMRDSDLTPGGGNAELKKKRKEERKQKNEQRKQRVSGETKSDKKKRKKQEKAEFNSSSKGVKGLE